MTVGPAAALAALVGVGMGASAFLVVAALGGIVLGYRLWPFELLVGLGAAYLAHALFRRVSEAQRPSGPGRDGRARRAIQRLSYRRGRSTLSVDLVARETLLDDAEALAAVSAMRAEGLIDGPDDAFRLRAWPLAG